MNKLIILLTFILSINVNAQYKVQAPVDSQGLYNYETHMYDVTDVKHSINLTFEIFSNEDYTIKVLKVGLVVSYGTIYSDYRIIEGDAPNNTNSFITYVGENCFNDIIGLRYLENKFTLFYNWDNIYKIWTKYYSGLLIKF